MERQLYALIIAVVAMWLIGRIAQPKTLKPKPPFKKSQ